MSYPKDLDEYSVEDLENEIKRRRILREQGICDYCGQTGDKPHCRMFDRHQTAALQWQRLLRIEAGIPQLGITTIGPR